MFCHRTYDKHKPHITNLSLFSMYKTIAMRIILFIFFSILTAGLVIALNMQLPIGGTKSPRLGYFLSPQQGFWQNAEDVNKDFNGEVKLTGLNDKADVYFDERLVPHVFANNDHDAFYIQGFLHAKFRLWQMEFQTNAAAGRLSEIVGKEMGGRNFVDVDKFFRRLGMVYAAENSLKIMEANPETKAAMDAYTAGVNSYILSLQNDIPFEYKLLDYKPELWTNLKSALFLKYMSLDLAGGENDFEMTEAKKFFSAADIDKLYPLINDSLSPIIPARIKFAPPSIQTHLPQTADSLYFSTPVKDSSYLKQNNFNYKPDKDNGSNNWAVSGSKTKSGRPILCNDPHLGLNLPSLWYEMQITSPNVNTYGASFPGTPCVIIGFNNDVAWGVTNSQRDVRDYYEITFKDTSRQEYFFNGDWHKTEWRDEIIKTRGAANTVEHIAITAFGPVMYDKNYASRNKDGKSYACRWKAHDASNELMTFFKLNRAKNYADYKDAISTFTCPGQNFVFASKTGDVAMTQQGQFPAKWRRQGDFLMPGIDTAYAWQGIIPNNENPQELNNMRGFSSSANQRPVDFNYPYYMSGGFIPTRGWIINRKLSAMNNITVDDMKALQTDNYNVFAEMARPVLNRHLDKKNITDIQQKYLDVFNSWNLMNDVNEEGPTVMKVWWDNLDSVVFNDEFARFTNGYMRPYQTTLLEGLLKDENYKFCDDITTTQKETMYDAVTKAFVKASAILDSLDRSGSLVWGKYKSTGVQHLLKIPALSALNLNVGGGEHIINCTKQFHGPSWRMIVQMTDDIEAYCVYPGGQSGNPGSPYYNTFINTWATSKYYKINFLKQADAAKMKWHATFTKA